ncbi:MAG: hypothetical protein ABIH39_07040, partial [Candidatus Margulisiibacteriota bacterium]
ASITGLVNDLGVGLQNVRYRYEQVSENVKLTDGNRWELNPVLPDLTSHGVLTIFATDKVGNEMQTRYVYQQDTVPPEIEVHSISSSSDYLYYDSEKNILYFGANYHNPETINIRGYFYDEQSGVGKITAFSYRGKTGEVTRYKENPNKWQVSYVFWPKNSLFNADLQEPEDIVIRFYDKTGNYTDQRITVVYDKKIPEPPRAVKAHPQKAIYSGRITSAILTWEEGTDDQSGIWYYRAGLDPDWQKNPARESSENIDVDYGWNTFYAVAIDNVGNVSLPGTDTLEVNPVHPRLIYPGNNSGINDDLPVFRWSQTIEDGYYILELSEDINFLKNVISYRVNAEKLELPPSNRLKHGHVYYWRVQAYDRKGQIYTKIEEIKPSSFFVDTEGPQKVGFTIEGGREFTNKEVVSINVQIPDAARAIYSEYYDFRDAKWQEYNNTTDFKLTTRNGKKRIYAKYMDDLENRSEFVSRVIFLDTKPPKMFTRVEVAQYRPTFRTSVYVQVVFNEPVSANLESVEIEFPGYYKTDVEKVRQQDTLWEGICFLPEEDGYTGLALLTISGNVTDLAGNQFLLPITYRLKIDNIEPEIKTFDYSAINPSGYYDYISFSLSGEPKCDAYAVIDDKWHIILNEISPGNYEGVWRIDTFQYYKHLPIHMFLLDKAENRTEVVVTRSLTLNPGIIERIEDFETSIFPVSFKSQLSLHPLISVEAKGEGLRVLQIDYSLTKEQQWAAFSFQKIKDKNYSGYKPVVQFWLKGSGSENIKGLFKIRTRDESIANNWLSVENGHIFSLSNKKWQLIKIQLTEYETKRLYKLGYIDMIFFTNGIPEKGTFFLDDLTITYSVL